MGNEGGPVRSQLISGRLVDNILHCEIDPNNFDLRRGVWQVSFEAIQVVSHISGKKPLSLSLRVGLNWFRAFEQTRMLSDSGESVERRVLRPATLTLLFLNQTANDQRLNLYSSRPKVWFKFQSVEQFVNIHFGNLDFDPAAAAGTPESIQHLDFEVHMVLLFQQL
jgi:hypothetical protein